MPLEYRFLSMPFIAIIGAGATGGAIAQKTVARNRIAEVRLIDAAESVARGKALDIQQSAALEHSGTRIDAAAEVAAAAGAAVIVLADQAGSDSEHGGEPGLALLRQLARVEYRAPIVFAGAAPRELMARAVSELHLEPSRLIGSAPLALESALRALAGLMVDASGVEVTLRVVGVPPHATVVLWEEASIFGQPLSTRLAAHEIAGLAARIPGLWPPGPYLLASAAARVIEAAASGSRRRFSCFVPLARGVVAAMPVEVGEDGAVRILEPALTRQERTQLENALEQKRR